MDQLGNTEIVITEPDVPVLLADSFGTFASASYSGLFISLWDYSLYRENPHRIFGHWRCCGGCGAGRKQIETQEKKDNPIPARATGTTGTARPPGATRNVDAACATGQAKPPTGAA